MSTIAEAAPRGQQTLQRIPLLRLLPAAWKLRFRGDFSEIVAFSRTIQDGLRGGIPGLRFVYFHRPEHIEAVCVKNDKYYAKPLGSEGLRRFIGNGLLTSEGQFHLRQRRMIQPAFHKKRLDAYAQCMVDITSSRIARWQDGQDIDINVEMMGVTLSIIAKTMFNAEVEGDAQKVAHALDLVMETQERYGIRWIGKIFDALPLPSTRRLHKALAELDAIMYRIIQEHCDADEDSGDLLSMLLQAKAEEDGQGMSGLQLRDECITLFLAGHETTAVLMSWVWKLLSENPVAEAALHAEIDTVLGARPAALADLDKLTYTRNVITEAMRLYPPAYGFGRQAIEDNQIGPYLIRKGTIIGISPFLVQRQAEWFPEPDAFDPDRWRPERAAGIPKFAFCPFGGGSRKCIGDQFAWMEATLMLATIARQWQVRVDPKHPAVPDPRITLRPRDGMPVRLSRRHPAPSA